MKQLFFILATLLTSTLVSAQKNFEGSVTYRLHSSAGKKPDAELKVTFGKMKLKAMFKEGDEYDKDVLIIRMDSAAVYNVNYEEKTFKKNALVLTSPVQKPGKKIIQGYSATPASPENTGLSGLLGGMLGASNVIFYLADSLHYYIPAAFAGNKELLMIQQNKVVLGADIQIVNHFSELEDSSANKPNLITVEAIDIKPMVTDENEFIIPIDFVSRKEMFYPDSAVVDTPVLADPVVAVDTVAVPAPTIKSAKKKPAKPTAPKSKSTPKGALRKE